MTLNIALPCLDAEGLRYGPVTACSAVYDRGYPLRRDDSADGPSPGGWALCDGVVVLGHAPDGIVTADATIPGAVSHVFQPLEVAPDTLQARGAELRRAGLLK